MLDDSRTKPWVCLLLCLGLLLLLCLPLRRSTLEQAVPCAAETEAHYLVPVGQTVGIKLFSHGVMVVGLSQVETAGGSCSPAEECGLQVGDIITEIACEPVNSIEEVTAAMQSSGGEAMTITALRSGRRMELTTEAAACLADGSYKLGAWIRDSMAGIGTVTWYDPENNRFAALGHGVTDVDTGLLMPFKSGSIMPSSVSGILKGSEGQPGVLHGTFDLTTDLGELTANTDQGIFGTAYEDAFGGEALPVARRGEVHTGAATIRSNISGTEVREYDVEILRLYPENMSDCQNIMIQVTDKALLEATGGVVQGMSGSPILQDGRLVGAVTHVLLNDPTRGYGILAENMLDAAG